MYSSSVTLSSWVIVASLWFRSGTVMVFFDQFRHLRTDVTSIWPWIVKVLVVVLAFGLHYGISSAWYIDTLSMSWSKPWWYVYEASFFWVITINALPVLWYVLLSDLVLGSLRANNTALTRAITVRAAAEPMGCSQNEHLGKIYAKSLTLRKLYGEMEDVLSLALLSSKLSITIKILFNVFYIVYMMMTDHSWKFIYISFFPIILDMVIIVIMGNTADNITKAVRIIQRYADS